MEIHNSLEIQWKFIKYISLKFWAQTRNTQDEQDLKITSYKWILISNREVVTFVENLYFKPYVICIYITSAKK